MDTSVQRHYCSIEQDNIYSFVSHINGNNNAYISLFFSCAYTQTFIERHIYHSKKKCTDIYTKISTETTYIYIYLLSEKCILLLPFVLFHC